MTGHEEVSLETICRINDVLREIGGHGDEVSYSYSAGLTRRILQGGPIEQMTVGELLQVCRDHNEWFNVVYGSLDQQGGGVSG